MSCYRRNDAGYADGRVLDGPEWRHVGSPTSAPLSRDGPVADADVGRAADADATDGGDADATDPDADAADEWDGECSAADDAVPSARVAVAVGAV